MERRLAAIMATDVVGYSRLIGGDEEGTIAALQVLRADLVDPKISEHHGRIVKLMGDGMLAEFPSVVDAVRAALETQQAVADHNSDIPKDKRIEFRIGINLGDVVVDGDDIQGDGVNVAARLEGLAPPGGICVSESVHQLVRDRLDLPFEDLGDQEVKNIARPVRVWQWSVNDTPVSAAAARGLGTPPPIPDKPSICVLPFENLSNDADADYFSVGITDNIITALTRFDDICIIALKSAVSAATNIDTRAEFGRQLGVRYLVEGSVLERGKKVRITVRLIEAETGKCPWSENFDRDIGDIFSILDEITNIVVTTLSVRVADADRRRAEQKPIKDMAAFDHVLRGRYHLNLDKMDDELTARHHFEQALICDDQCAAAYAGLAMSYVHEYRAFWTEDHDGALAAAFENADKAIALDEANIMGYYALASSHFARHEYELADMYMEKAQALNPNDYHNLCNAGFLMTASGHLAEGIACSMKAMRVSPLVPDNCHLFIGLAEFAAAHYQESLNSFAMIRGEWLSKLGGLTACHGQLGQISEADATAQRFLSLAASISGNPNDFVERLRKYWKGMFHFQDPEVEERFYGSLRKAGLPI